MAAEDPHTLVAGLIATHGARLRRFLLSRVRNAADVPDITQEVYLRLLRIQNAASVRSPEAYLFTVAQHVVHQHVFEQAAIPPTAPLNEVLAAQHAPSHADPEMEVHAHQCLEHLQHELDQLSPKVRATFLLSRRDGLSFEAIAERLGTTPAMVKKYLMKALVQFRQRLESGR